MNGESFYESNQVNPLIQQITVYDDPINYYTVEIEFTEQELNTWRTFCRKFSTLVEGKL